MHDNNKILIWTVMSPKKNRQSMSRTAMNSSQKFISMNTLCMQNYVVSVGLVDFFAVRKSTLHSLHGIGRFIGSPVHGIGRFFGGPKKLPIAIYWNKLGIPNYVLYIGWKVGRDSQYELNKYSPRNGPSYFWDCNKIGRSDTTIFERMKKLDDQHIISLAIIILSKQKISWAKESPKHP